MTHQTALLSVADAAAQLYPLAQEVRTCRPPLDNQALEAQMLTNEAGLAEWAKEEPEFQLVVLGEFSSGKSSFINAFAGRDLARVAATIETAHVSIFRHGEDEGAFFNLRSGERRRLPLEEGLAILAQQGQRSFLLDELACVELVVAAEGLKDYVVVDTPGLATMLRSHEALTLDLVSHSSAVLWVFDANQAGTATERDYLRDHLHHRMVLGLLNKADDVEPDELEEVRQAALSAAPELLREVLPVSSLDARRAQLAGDHEGLQRSGLPAVRQWLSEQLLGREALIQETERSALLQYSTRLLFRHLKQRELRLRDVVARSEQLEGVLQQRRESLSGRLRSDIRACNTAFVTERLARFDQTIGALSDTVAMADGAEALLGVSVQEEHIEQLTHLVNHAYHDQWSATSEALAAIEADWHREAPDLAQTYVPGSEDRYSEAAMLTGAGAVGGGVAGAAIAAASAVVTAAILPWAVGIGAAGGLAAALITKMRAEHNVKLARSELRVRFRQECERLREHFDERAREELLPLVAEQNRLAEQRVREQFLQQHTGGHPLQTARDALARLKEIELEVHRVAGARKIDLTDPDAVDTNT